MSERSFALGVDFGTNSVRALIVDTATGEEVGTAVSEYRRGDQGVFTDPKNPHLARQHPADFFDGFYECVAGAMSQMPSDGTIVGIGVDTTGSTPIPCDEWGAPLAMSPDFEGNLEAMAWLWKDHTAHGEAEEITQLARKRGEPYLAKCGGTYSSEWFWSKILRCARSSPEVFARAHTWVEAQDCIPAWLTGTNAATSIKRGICAAGHKAMYHESWGGLPSAEFLAALHPGLAGLRERLYDSAETVGASAGGLDPTIALKVGLKPLIPVSVGAMDAHLGAVGSGVRPGTIVKIMGTSTCDILVGGADTPDIPGVCGIVPGSVIPGMMGIEAGQSAVGDLFNWAAQKLGGGSHEALTLEAQRLKPGESGLLALDWNNGNRTILVDPLLSGLLVGQTLHTTAAEIYRAMIEATAFGARKIIERIEEYGVKIEKVVVCGGIGEKSPLAMQIYADVCNRPMHLSRSAQTCALGSAIAGAVAGGAHGTILEGIDTMTGLKEEFYSPAPKAVSVNERLYRLYSDLHDAFGKVDRNPDLHGLMKELFGIRRDSV